MSDGGISITGLTIGGAALTTLGGMVGAWVRSRYGRTEIRPQPLEVKGAPAYVTCEQCRDHRQVIGNRLDAISPQLSKINEKLDEIDKKAETRSSNLHKRLDPLVATVASTKDRLNDHLSLHNIKDKGGT